MKEPGANIYAAIAEALTPLDDFALTPDERRRVVADTAEFIAGEMAALPLRLLVLFHIGLTGFRVLIRGLNFQSFCALPPAKRRQIAESWAYGRVGLMRQFFRPLRSTAFLAFFEHPLIEAKLAPHEPPAGASARGDA
jgi:hypothetical protein